MTDVNDPFPPPPSPPAEYWHALKVIARHYQINIELLFGSADHTQPPNAELFYLQLAEKMLHKAIEEAPEAEPISAHALVACRALNPSLRWQDIDPNDSKPLPLFKKGDSWAQMTRWTDEALEAATVLVIGEHKKRRGRKPGLIAKSKLIKDLMIAAGIDFLQSWSESLKLLDAHIDDQTKRQPLQDRGSFKIEMKALVGKTRDKAKHVFTVAKGEAQDDQRRSIEADERFDSLPPE